MGWATAVHRALTSLRVTSRDSGGMDYSSTPSPGVTTSPAGTAAGWTTAVHRALTSLRVTSRDSGGMDYSSTPSPDVTTCHQQGQRWDGLQQYTEPWRHYVSPAGTAAGWTTAVHRALTSLRVTSRESSRMDYSSTPSPDVTTRHQQGQRQNGLQQYTKPWCHYVTSRDSSGMDYSSTPSPDVTMSPAGTAAAWTTAVHRALTSLRVTSRDSSGMDYSSTPSPDVATSPAGRAAEWTTAVHRVLMSLCHQQGQRQNGLQLYTEPWRHYASPAGTAAGWTTAVHQALTSLRVTSRDSGGMDYSSTPNPDVATCHQQGQRRDGLQQYTEPWRRYVSPAGTAAGWTTAVHRTLTSLRVTSRDSGGMDYSSTPSPDVATCHQQGERRDGLQQYTEPWRRYVSPAGTAAGWTTAVHRTLTSLRVTSRDSGGMDYSSTPSPDVATCHQQGQRRDGLQQYTEPWRRYVSPAGTVAGWTTAVHRTLTSLRVTSRDSGRMDYSSTPNPDVATCHQQGQRQDGLQQYTEPWRRYVSPAGTVAGWTTAVHLTLTSLRVTSRDSGSMDYSSTPSSDIAMRHQQGQQRDGLQQYTEPWRRYVTSRESGGMDYSSTPSPDVTTRHQQGQRQNGLQQYTKPWCHYVTSRDSGGMDYSSTPSPDVTMSPAGTAAAWTTAVHRALTSLRVTSRDSSGMDYSSTPSPDVATSPAGRAAEWTTAVHRVLMSLCHQQGQRQNGLQLYTEPWRHYASPAGTAAGWTTAVHQALTSLRVTSRDSGGMDYSSTPNPDVATCHQQGQRQDGLQQYTKPWRRYVSPAGTAAGWTTAVHRTLTSLRVTSRDSGGMDYSSTPNPDVATCHQQGQRRDGLQLYTEPWRHYASPAGTAAGWTTAVHWALTSLRHQQGERRNGLQQYTESWCHYVTSRDSGRMDYSCTPSPDVITRHQQGERRDGLQQYTEPWRHYASPAGRAAGWTTAVHRALTSLRVTSRESGRMDYSSTPSPDVITRHQQREQRDGLQQYTEPWRRYITSRESGGMDYSSTPSPDVATSPAGRAAGWTTAVHRALTSLCHQQRSGGMDYSSTPSPDVATSPAGRAAGWTTAVHQALPSLCHQQRERRDGLQQYTEFWRRYVTSRESGGMDYSSTPSSDVAMSPAEERRDGLQQYTEPWRRYVTSRESGGMDYSSTPSSDVTMSPAERAAGWTTAVHRVLTSLRITSRDSSGMDYSSTLSPDVATRHQQGQRQNGLQQYTEPWRRYVTSSGMDYSSTPSPKVATRHQHGQRQNGLQQYTEPWRRYASPTGTAAEWTTAVHRALTSLRVTSRDSGRMDYSSTPSPDVTMSPAGTAGTCLLMLPICKFTFRQCKLHWEMKIYSFNMHE